jgi:hypothetical protein
MVVMNCAMVTAKHVSQMPKKAGAPMTVVQPQDLSYAEPTLAAVSAPAMTA